MRAVLAFLLLASPAFAQELAKPVRLEADGKPVDTEIGHAAPFVYDFDKDGKRDLLVGQFGGGRLKIFRNVGTNAAPRFDASTWFETGGKIVTTPSG